MNQPTLRGAVRAAADRLLAEPRADDLLKYTAHELVLTHRFAVHFEAVAGPILQGRSVDIDYNRHAIDKKFDPSGRLFRPDVIVHHRGVDNGNLLVIEWKKRSPRPASAENHRAAMLSRLRFLTGPPFGYTAAVYIESHLRGLMLTWLDEANEPEEPEDVPLPRARD